MVIDFTEAVSAAKYLSVSSDNLAQLFCFVFKGADTEEARLKAT